MSQSGRIAITVPLELDTSITELSKLLKTTKTKIILGILQDMKPHIEKTIKAVKLAQKGKDELLSKALHDSLDEAKESLGIMTSDLFEHENKGETNGD